MCLLPVVGASSNRTELRGRVFFKARGHDGVQLLVLATMSYHFVGVRTIVVTFQTMKVAAWLLRITGDRYWKEQIRFFIYKKKSTGLVCWVDGWLARAHSGPRIKFLFRNLSTQTIIILFYDCCIRNMQTRLTFISHGKRCSICAFLFGLVQIYVARCTLILIFSFFRTI